MSTPSNNEHETLFGALKNIAGELMAVSILFILFVPVLVAPMFGYYIRGNLMATYSIHDENDETIKTKMLPVWLFLWSVAIIGWFVIGYVCVSNKGCGFQ